MPKRLHQRGKAGNLFNLIHGASQARLAEARPALLPEKMQQLFDEKAGYQAYRPGEAAKHIR